MSIYRGVGTTGTGGTSDLSEMIQDAIGKAVESTTPRVQRFSGNGTTTQFTLDTWPGAEENTMVFINGAYQNKDTYSLNAAIVVFSEAPPVGTNNIEIITGPASQLVNYSSSGVTYLANGTGAILNNVQDKLRETISVKDFGAVGDGVTDDRTALVNALTAAAGRTVILESGKTYKVGSAIVFNGDVSLKTDGAEKAVIFHNGQSFWPMTISGSLVATTTLSSAQQVNNRGWNCTSVSGVHPGMLMEIVSSASWYHDPRPTSTDARKSELHRVGYLDGSTVYSEDPANDGYNVPTETVTVNFYNPASVRIENVCFRCVAPAYQVNAPRVVGVSVQYANEPVLIDVDVENALSNGIQFLGCYRGIVDRGHTHTANHYSNGYGVSITGSSHCAVMNRTFWQCRRGVDVTGFNVISRHTLIENCTNVGGGINSEGTVYGFKENGDVGAAQYGFGSHGPADHTIYRNNRVFQMHTPFNVRGRNEIIEGNYIVGRTRYGTIELAYGENVWIRNNICYAGWGTLKDGTIYEGGANSNYRRAEWFIRVIDTYQGGEIVIENNDVELQDRFIDFMDGAVQENVSIVRNKVRFQTGSSLTTAYLAYNEGASESIVRWRIIDNDYVRYGGTAGVEMFYNLAFSESSTLKEGNAYTGTYTPTITNGTNVSSSSTSINRFIRVGNQVTVYGQVVLEFTSSLTNSSARISLPIPTSFGSVTQARLTGTSYEINSPDVISGIADTTNDAINIRCYPSKSGTITFNYIFVYEV